jgi:PPOX class probable F420-dependent enzyme
MDRRMARSDGLRLVAERTRTTAIELEPGVLARMSAGKRLGRRLASMHERLRHPEASLSRTRAATCNSVTFLAGAKYLLLESESVDGTPVGAPMWFAAVDDTIFVRTDSESSQLRGIRRRPSVRVAACTMRGLPFEDYIECVARIVPRQREGQAEAALRRSYGLLRWLLGRFLRDDHVYLELTPLDAEGRQAPDDASPASSIGMHEVRVDDTTSPDAA